MIRIAIVPTKRTPGLETSHSISWIAECVRFQVPTLTQCIPSLAQNAGDYGLYLTAILSIFHVICPLAHLNGWPQLDHEVDPCVP